MLAVDSAAWGGMALLRASDRDHFTADEAELVASVFSELAEGLRRAILYSALSGEHRESPEPAGLALLAPDGSIELVDAAAERWLAELREAGKDDPVPRVIAAVASRALSIVDGPAEAGAVARARAPTRSGRWLLVRGSVLGNGDAARVAVMIEPLRPHELAPLIADAYGLTERERAVTRTVAEGLTTDSIAARLYISPWTVQDHLKAIFEKLDVSTRGELVARLFFEQYAPRLNDETPLGSDGWFAPAAH